MPLKTKITAYQLIFICFFSGHAFSLVGNNVCYEPTEKTSNLHLIWIGGQIPAEKRENLKLICKDITRNSERGDNYKIHLWSGDNLEPQLRNMKECGKMIIYHTTNKLLETYKWGKELYDFYSMEKIFAADSDVIRLLAVLDLGGCYMDIGFKINSEQCGYYLSKEKPLADKLDLDRLPSLSHVGNDIYESVWKSGKIAIKKLKIADYSSISKHRIRGSALANDRAMFDAAACNLIKQAGGEAETGLLVLLRNKNYKQNFFVYESALAGFQRENVVDKFEKDIEFNRAFNGFFASQKRGQILDKMVKDFESKRSFYVQNKNLVSGLFKYCETASTVLMLTGQSAFNQVLFNIKKSLGDSYYQSNVKNIKLGNVIPYSGSSSWLRSNDEDCGIFLSCLKRTDGLIDDSSGGLIVVAGTVLAKQIELFRRKPTHTSNAMDFKSFMDKTSSMLRDQHARENSRFDSAAIARLCECNQTEKKDILKSKKMQAFIRAPATIRRMQADALVLDDLDEAGRDKFNRDGDDLFYGIKIQCERSCGRSEVTVVLDKTPARFCPQNLFP